ILPLNNEDEDVFEDDFIFDEDIFNEDDEELERLISLLPKDREEEHVMDEIEFVPVLEKVSPVEAENAVDKIIRFLYEQEAEFGEYEKQNTINI
ncbi:1535_t:CDS:2, partial [Funneliformis mosseae]